MEQKELKPCPFWGGEVEAYEYKDCVNRVKFGVECRNNDCEIQPITDWYAIKQEASEAWNRRI